MSATFEYGPLDTYEIIWNSGHVEHIAAHQVLAPQGSSFFGTPSPRDHQWMFHGEVDGRWRLLLVADAEDVRSVRNVTHTQDAVSGGQSDV